MKGLILRNDPLSTAIYPRLLKILENEGCGKIVAYGFSTLLEPDELLSKENHCIISPLHKQKVFATLIPSIFNSYRSASASIKQNYLIAFSGIIQWLSYETIESDVGSVTPLLLQSLSIEGENDIKVANVEQITNIIQQNSQVFEDHASSLISLLINLSSSQKHSPTLREKAIQCLALLAERIRKEIIIPYRKQVIKKLTPALDDRRRAVRTEAVRCRTKWINLDLADDDDD